MTIALVANLLTSILCAAVLVQSVRMARSLNQVKDGDLPLMVAALDKATGEARGVLSEMKRTLGADCAQHARQVERARELRDELELITGIGNAAAERILGAVKLANADRDEGGADAVDGGGVAAILAAVGDTGTDDAAADDAPVVRAEAA
ncbi:DUF6468 domain-containing protein [uncultured Sphingomonas sp.]|mgnify:CR=1 FL=1|uniref:DUF6468 domain-containing protein n=1 Tax=uncultured Sphingomonas sp. TaxID=158754 RepID=UPI00260C1CD5|nr:DUF6468 domain-containing protein [uncultured Sphingomonas sp.]